MFKHILFDLDGTISDPKLGICTSVKEALEHFGITVNSIDELTPFIGPPLRDSFRDFYGFTPDQYEEAIKVYRSRYSTIGLFENELYPGMKDLLKTLKEKGMHLALASSKPRVFVEKILEHFEISEYFEIIMGCELDGSREKKIDVIYECLRLLNSDTPINKTDFAMVGDRKFDVEAGNEAGLASIGVTYGYGSREELETAGADLIAETVEELLDILSK